MFQCCKYLCVLSLFGHAQLFVTLWTVAHQASLSITNSQSFSNSCPSCRWWHPTISSSFIPFSSCLILHTTVLERVAMLTSRGSSQPRDQTYVTYSSCTASGFFTTELLGKPSACGTFLKVILISFFNFWSCYMACGILVPNSGITPVSPAMEALDHQESSQFVVLYYGIPGKLI